ncbi:MAG: molybdopterin converting factor subunit 1 [Arenicellales bacterium]|jgi:molybdopterin synthase sulfur carrier subunit
MNIRVLFFASLRDISGVSEQQLDVQAGTSIASLWQQISAGFELLPEKVLCAVNQEYVDTDYQLHDGDQEVAFFPPVTGG